MFGGLDLALPFAHQCAQPSASHVSPSATSALFKEQLSSGCRLIYYTHPPFNIQTTLNVGSSDLCTLTHVGRLSHGSRAEAGSLDLACCWSWFAWECFQMQQQTHWYQAPHFSGINISNAYSGWVRSALNGKGHKTHIVHLDSLQVTTVIMGYCALWGFYGTYIPVYCG